MNNDYSFSIASLEIIIALSAAFIIGALLCYLLRLIGRLFRGKPAEPDSMTVQQTQPHTKQVYIDRKPATHGHRDDNISEPSEPTGFQAAFPEPRRPSPPVIERQPIPQPPQPEPAPVNRLVDGGSTYEADIDTLIRRGSSKQHAVTLPQGSRNHDMDASFASRARESLNSPAPRDPVVTTRNNDLHMPADDHIDDLKKLEGIGPNIEKLLNQYGIRSYARLATLSRDQLRDVLAAGGNEFKMHDPKSWPYQAELAAKQNWERLREYQEFLIEGRNR